MVFYFQCSKFSLLNKYFIMENKKKKKKTDLFERGRGSHDHLKEIVQLEPISDISFQALMTTTASVKRKEATADHRYGANTLWMFRRSLAMTVPMTWIQTDDPGVSVRFYHKPLRAL